jgi:uncharacterized protein YjbI with pentapeptide repeats
MEELAKATAETCGVKMSDDKPCGRPIHSVPEHDQRPVCLMHSKDPAKSDAEFQAEFERILTEAERAGTLADFTRFVFCNADYVNRTFVPPCCFGGAIFTKTAGFHSATFTQDAGFMHVTFTKDASFSSAKFKDAFFSFATFTQDAQFHNARFTQDADFKFVTFAKSATFEKARFTQDADFTRVEFKSRGDFELTTFSGAATFRETRFRQDSHNAPGLEFSDVQIAHPENVEFYNTDLGQALFHNTDVSKFDFTLVKWRNRRRTEWLRYFGRQYWEPRFCLFEENVYLLSAWALVSSEDSPDERNYSLIAETYQQLKRNYDAKGDYWTAGHWHYGEMEMKRLHSRWRSRPLRWLSHNFSLVALYKYASAYGESYMIPLVWLAAVITVFAILYPIPGLELSKDSGGGVVRYWNVAEFFRTHCAEHPSGWPGLILHGFMTSISVAGFQRELKYAPSYPWGRLLALIELLLTTTLGALFALAIRRQFKRS